MYYKFLKMDIMNIILKCIRYQKLQKSAFQNSKDILQSENFLFS